MSITTFIPEVWSARLLDNLNKNLVFANLVNRDYEGEIKQYGDKVHINSLNEITTKTYTRNTDIDAPEELATTEQMLEINQGDYFNIGIDDVDRVQARAELMDKAMANASYKLAEKVDTYIGGLLKEGKLKDGLGADGSAIVINKENAYEFLVKMRTVLDKGNVPKQGRWVVLPPEFEGFMLLDPRFAYNTGASESRLLNGSVGRAAGFDIYISNNVPNSSNEYKIIGSYNGSCTYANQIIKTEAYRPEKRFSDAVKGLNIYGGKVTRENAIAVGTVKFQGE
ncbi:MAG: P22 phage major capsid protein family protein [Lachnospirales bacterium]